MAISMKDLHSSSDEEIQNEDFKDEKNQHMNLILHNSVQESSLDTNLHNTVAEVPKQFSKGEESKALWIKGQVAESLKRFSTRRTPTVLVDNSINDSFEEDNMKYPIFPPRLTKTVSEPDVKMTSENSESRDSTSKKHWIKGHINNYITKSKRLYLNRNEVGTQDKRSPNKSPTKSPISNYGDSNEQLENTAALDYITSANKLTDDTITSNAPLDDCKLLNLPSSSNSPSSSPSKSQAIENDAIHILDNNDLGSTLELDIKNETLPSKLTFSELLNSDCSSSAYKMELQQPLHQTCDDSDEEFVNYTINSTEIISEEQEINNLTDQIMKEDLQYHLRPGEGTSVTYVNIWVCTCLTCAYFLCPLPPYIHGIITGSVVTYLLICIVVWLLCPSAEIYDNYQSNLKSFLKRSMQPEMVKGLPKLDALVKPKDLKGWLLMATTFDGVFDKDLAKEVFSLIHKETLYIFLCKIIESEFPKPSQKRKKLLKGKSKKLKRLMAEQQVPIFSFECACQVDLSDSSLTLKPDDLPIRRIWNRKYPIVLTIPKGKLKRKTIDLTLEELTLTIDDMIEGRNGEDLMKDNILNDKEEIFYLFGNTGREKEDWFYRLQLCIAPLKHQVTFKDINENKLSKKPSDSYPHYMAELIKESEKVMQRTANGKKMEPYLAWLNIFLGRAFWDFWHDSVWTQRLAQKVQSRLSKLNTPPFITDIKLKDLNCGHNIPIIHKGSMPVLDEHGIWTDLQVSYKGYFTLTLETQLNIDYYVGLVSSIVKQKIDPRENVQLSKISKLSGLPNQSDDNADYNSIDKDIQDSEGITLPEVDEESVFHDEIQDVYSDAFEQPYLPGLDNEIDPVMADPRTKAFLQSRTGKKVVSLVGWLAKSKIAKRVAETDFAKKAYERAYKKFQKMPIVLKVEIQSVKGNVAVNIPPPPTNRLWYGFRGNPVIFITASPKVGDKQVRLTYLTNWIERKLKEEFKNFLVLPNMQDLSINLMDSHINDLPPFRPDS